MKYIFICILFAAQVATAQVGIGTLNPSSNSILDLTSPDKGLLLPRVNDTGSVSNPSAGLMIYDINTKTPAFHNGAKWNSLTSASALSGTYGDSITYSFFGPGSFSPGVYQVTAMSFGGSNAGFSNSVSIQDVSFSKTQDYNSTHFFKAMILGSMVGGIEFKMYVPGQATPYYSVKLSNWKVSSMSQSVSIGGDLFEAISLNPENIGFKDWTNNLGFSYNILTEVIGPY
ncbi:MAG: type VI secretion system tube protein Hcp [Bacteroidales bacterium]|nr:type VI secretion system tube protein Hcp [Bacteroidales bacterium]